MCNVYTYWRVLTNSPVKKFMTNMQLLFWFDNICPCQRSITNIILLWDAIDNCSGKHLSVVLLVDIVDIHPVERLRTFMVSMLWYAEQLLSSAILYQYSLLFVVVVDNCPCDCPMTSMIHCWIMLTIVHEYNPGPICNHVGGC